MQPWMFGLSLWDMVSDEFEYKFGKFSALIRSIRTGNVIFGTILLEESFDHDLKLGDEWIEYSTQHIRPLTLRADV